MEYKTVLLNYSFNKELELDFIRSIPSISNFSFS